MSQRPPLPRSWTSPAPPSTTSSRRARSGQADEKARLGQPRPYVVFQHQSGRYPVKRDVRSVSILKDGRAVFNIAGNKYRIVVWINYPYRVVCIRFIGTHRRYDAIDAQSI